MLNFKKKNHFTIKTIKNIDRLDLTDKKHFFNTEILNNQRIIFGFYNFIQENNNYIDKFKILDQYFEAKALLSIKQKDESLSLNLKNIDVVENTYTCKVDDKKRVSIVLTTYNTAEFLAVSLNSLLMQTYPNLEIIVVDDASTDNTLEIVQEFQSLYKNKIKLIKLQKNHGSYIAKNIGASYATGDLITFHDADDWAHPQRIEEHVKAHLKDKKVKFSISKLVRVTEDGFFYAKQVYPLDRLSMVSLMIDKTLIDEIGYFRKHRLGSDTEYFERLKKFTKWKFERIDKVLMFCSHRENSLTTSPETGVAGFGTTNKRQHYWDKWNAWHVKLKKARRKPFVKFDKSKYEYEIIE